MKIYSVNQPIFSYNGKNQYVEEKMFTTFGQIDSFIKDYEDRFGDSVIMVILSVSNMSGEELIKTVHGDPILFLRYKFIKVIEGATIGEYIKSVDTLLNHKPLNTVYPPH